MNSYRLYRGLRALFFGPAPLRRRALHELASVLASYLGGHYIGEDRKRWLKEEAFMRKFKQLSPLNSFSMERKFALKELAKAAAYLPGAAAECGCYDGGSAWFVAKELPDTPLYLFDSFEGLSNPREEDVSPDGMQQWKEGDLAISEERLRANLSGLKGIHIMKGWIPERFPEVSGERFKFVHIDVDLYQPTLDSLAFFYPRMESGGIIVIDDYGFENCPGAYAATQEFMHDKAELIVHLPTGQGVIFTRCHSLSEDRQAKSDARQLQRTGDLAE